MVNESLEPDPVDEPDSAAAWSVAVKESIALTAAYRFTNEFTGRTRTLPYGATVLIDMEYSAHELNRTWEHIDQDEPARWITSLSLTGSGEMSQDGRSVTGASGELSFYDTSRPLHAVLQAGRELLLSVPKSDLQLPDDLLEQLTATKYPSDTGLASALAATLLALSEMTQPAMQGRFTESARATARSASMLVRSLLIEELETRGALSTSPESRILAACERYIDEHLADLDLNPRTIAASLYISTRQLHAIFSKTDTTASVLIRRRRLERCKELLTEPQEAETPIASIARRCGLQNNSHFGVIFREFTGMTPGEYRAAFMGS